MSFDWRRLRIERPRRWWNRLGREARIAAATVGGVVVGVVLLASGVVALQISGGITVLAALLIARECARIPDMYISEPGANALRGIRAVRVRVPVWTWPATVVTVLAVFAGTLVRRQFFVGDVESGAFGDLGKGAIALAMMASLAFWNRDAYPRRLAVLRPRVNLDDVSPDAH